VQINLLLAPQTWEWFCIDGIQDHKYLLTVVWDKDGLRYHRGPGLYILAHGVKIAQPDRLERLTGELP
jgi:hypothetical protein